MFRLQDEVFKVWLATIGNNKEKEGREIKFSEEYGRQKKEIF